MLIEMTLQCVNDFTSMVYYSRLDKSDSLRLQATGSTFVKH